MHLRSNTACRLGLETADGGNDVVIIEGAAHLLERDDARPLADAVGFIEKYSELMGDGGFEQWSATFSVPIRIDVARVLAWDKQTGETPLPRRPLRPSLALGPRTRPDLDTPSAEPCKRPSATSTSRR